MELFPSDSNFNFMRMRHISLAIAAILMFAALGAMVFKGFNFALDFTGGNETRALLAANLPFDRLPRGHVGGDHGGPEVPFGQDGDDLDYEHLVIATLRLVHTH